MLLSQQPSQDPQDATFSDSRFQLDYLTQPNGLSDMLITWGQPNVLERAQDSDEVSFMVSIYCDITQRALGRLYLLRHVQTDWCPADLCQASSVDSSTNVRSHGSRR